MRNLNRHKLLKSLNLLCHFLQEKYKINYGGCCFLSYLIAKHLHKLGIDYNLVIYDSEEKNISCIEYEVLNKKPNIKCNESVTGYNSSNHYCIQIVGAGIVNDEEGECYKYIIPKVSYKSILWIYNNSDWNEYYKTKYNDIIKGIINAFFKEYEK
jgi:hypothetical protein